MSDLVKRLMSDHPGDDMREVYFSDEAPNFNIDPFNGDTSCGKCGGCGAWLTVVRPGKAQCDFCEGNYDAAIRWAAAARIEEMEAEVATARNDALEEAAKHTEQWVRRAIHLSPYGYEIEREHGYMAVQAADAIRALKSTTQT